MIQEDYVNFEVAKLLKEKGFDEGCFRYAENKEIYESGNWTVANVTGGGIGVPTLQMAMKWLEEQYGIFCVVYRHGSIDEGFTYSWQCVGRMGLPVGDDRGFGSAKDAYEDAIGYALEILI